jgi:hypothetical protein
VGLSFEFGWNACIVVVGLNYEITKSFRNFVRIRRFVMNNIAMMTMIARKEVQKEMDKYKFVMDGFNRDGMMFCNNATVTMDTDVGEVTTGVKDLKFCNVGATSIKDRFEDYVRKDELEDLIDKINNCNGYIVSHDDVADAFKLLHERFRKGNKKKNEISFLNYEKEIRGYELL